MSLHFILGDPGSGKSVSLIRNLIRSALAHPDQRHIILVPEQYTMQTQRDLVRMHPAHAVMNIDILSFERLAYRVLAECGREDLKILTPMGKNMILRRACDEHAGELTVYRKSLRKPGFISRLMSLLSEFYQYGVTDERLEKLQGQMESHPLLDRKLKDLRIFYDAMNRAKGDETIAAEELLTVLERLLSGSHFLDKTWVAMDNFTGFTPVQYQILRHILKRASRVEMAFLLPEDEWREESREEDLFHMSQQAVTACQVIARECGISYDIEFCAGDLRHKDSPELSFLSSRFLRETRSRTNSWDQGRPSSLQAYSLRNPREEADFAARSIRRMVMDGRCRYRDIALVTGDLDEYRPFLENAFRRYDIPVFMDQKRGILGNPLVEMLRSALRLTEQDFDYESVFRFLKCGIRILEPEDLDFLDNYCLAGRIRGRSRWEKEWVCRHPDDQAEAEDVNRANILRMKVLAVTEPVRELRRRYTGEAEMRHPVTVKERTAVLRALLESTGAGEQLCAMAADLRAEDRADLADEYEKTGEYVLSLLEQVDELLGDACVSVQEFSDILDAGLSEAKLGIIPSSVDRVQVGDVMRSRLGEIRCLFIIGFNEGVIPGIPAGGGILSEDERSLLESMELLLAPPAETVASQEKFYLYRLMTRPSEEICISFSRMGPDGKTRHISHLWERLQGIFPELKVSEDSSDRRILSRGHSEYVFASGLSRLKESPEDPFLAGLGQCLMETAPDQTAAMIEAAFVPERPDTIGRAAAAALYGDTISGSITRLEKYASCAYAHFLTYGLRLTERDDGVRTNADRGSFFHRTLELFFRICHEQGLNPSGLEEEERSRIAAECVQRAMDETDITPQEAASADQYLMKRWKTLADRTVWALCRMFSEEDFHIEALEMRFSGKNTPTLNLDLEEGRRLVLKGMVDRLDTLTRDGKVYLRIVDYKTGKVSLDLNKLLDGLQLQLPLYMNAVSEREEYLHPEEETLPAGICYYHLEEPMIEASPEEDQDKINERILKNLTMKGMVLDDPSIKEHLKYTGGEKVSSAQFRWLGEHVRRKAAEFGRDILDGRISAAPYRYRDSGGCTYCAFSAVCGFNERRAGCEPRQVKEYKKKEDIWAILKEETDGSEMDG